MMKEMNWKCPIQNTINVVLCHLSKQDIFPQFKKEYQKQICSSEVWKDYDRQTKKHYEKTLRKPFDYFKGQEYKKQKQTNQLAEKLKNKQECVDYFSWQGQKLFFKTQEINTNPEENHEKNKYYMFNKFNKRSFVSQTFDNQLQQHAQINLDRYKLVKPRRSFNQIRQSSQPSQSNKKNEKKNQYDISIIKNSQKSSPLLRRDTYLKSPVRIQRKSSNRSSIISNKIIEIQRSRRINEIQQKKVTVNQSKLIQCMKLISQSSHSSKSSMRLTKLQIKNIVTQRYGCDNITNFFFLDNILSYNQYEQFAKKLLNMDQQSILYMCFNLIDSNQDGQISDQDLSIMFEKSLNNWMIQSDYRMLIKYLLGNSEIHSKASSTELFSTQPNHLFFLNRRSSTKDFASNSKNRQKPLKFYSLMQTHQKIKQSGKLKKKLSRRQQRILQQYKVRSVRYDTFKQIFKQSLPMIYYDLLYVLFEIQIPNVFYYKTLTSIFSRTKMNTQINPENDIKMLKYYRMKTNLRGLASSLPRVKN